MKEEVKEAKPAAETAPVQNEPVKEEEHKAEEKAAQEQPKAHPS